MGVQQPANTGTGEEVNPGASEVQGVVSLWDHTHCLLQAERSD
jgi:hypothetical protein